MKSAEHAEAYRVTCESKYPTARDFLSDEAVATAAVAVAVAVEESGSAGGLEEKNS